MTTKAKLIVAMIVIGGAVATLNAILVGWYTFDQAQNNVTQIEASNSKVPETRKDLEEQIASASGAQKKALEEQLAGVEEEPITWIVQNDWLVMTGWLLVVEFGMLAAAATVLWRRDDTLPITWGEAIFYAFVAFSYLVIAFGFIPHYIVAIWDFKTGTWASPFSVWPTKAIAGLWNEDALGWQWDWKAIRDMIVAGWYVVALLAMWVFWYWAQEFPKRQAQKSAAGEMTSPYGRPMLSPEK